ncbi:MAG TPA: protein-disulfide reductase DsbD domain-containing protein [Bryobacteraceae bacterium]|nr:protein-disulfide reductase DsbD domain-containing protein [Bryobacteraceae bacterium]
MSCLLPFSLTAQQARVSVEPPAEIVAHPGSVLTEPLKIDVQPGFHVNSDKPKDEYVIPLKLTWLSGPLTIESVTYPKPEEIKVGTESLTVFTGNFSIQSRFTVPQQAQPGSSVMTGKLRYQACNNQMCLRPATVEVHVPVVIQ